MYLTGVKRSYNKMQKNSMMGNTKTIPSFASTKSEDGALNISHKEYICDIQGTSEFTLQNHLINPGNATLFPWLAQIAQNYDEYRFHGLIFHFRSTATDNTSTNSQIGTIIMAANYNSSASNFVNKQQMMEYAGAASAKVSNDLQFGIECDYRKNGGTAIEYVAPNGAVPVGEDGKTYMLANLQIATNQTQTTGQIGELWVTYKVTLRKPKYCVTNALCQPYLEHFHNAQFTTPTTCTTTGAGTETNPYLVATLSNGVSWLNVTPVLKLADSQGGSILSNGYTTNITGGRAGLYSYVGASGVDTLSTHAYGFRFPDTLGSGTYQFTYHLTGLDTDRAGTTYNGILNNSIFSPHQSSNVTIFGLKTSIDQQTLPTAGNPQTNPTNITISFKASIKSSAHANGTAALNIGTDRTYYSKINGTYAGIKISDPPATVRLFWTAAATCSLIINQLNPAVIN